MRASGRRRGHCARWLLYYVRLYQALPSVCYQVFAHLLVDGADAFLQLLHHVRQLVGTRLSGGDRRFRRQPLLPTRLSRRLCVLYGPCCSVPLVRHSSGGGRDCWDRWGRRGRRGRWGRRGRRCGSSRRRAGGRASVEARVVAARARRVGGVGWRGGHWSCGHRRGSGRRGFGRGDGWSGIGARSHVLSVKRARCRNVNGRFRRARRL